jgi:hypothetical protein
MTSDGAFVMNCSVDNSRLTQGSLFSFSYSPGKTDQRRISKADKRFKASYTS